MLGWTGADGHDDNNEGSFRRVNLGVIAIAVQLLEIRAQLFDREKRKVVVGGGKIVVQESAG